MFVVLWVQANAESGLELAQWTLRSSNRREKQLRWLQVAAGCLRRLPRRWARAITLTMKP